MTKLHQGLTTITGPSRGGKSKWAEKIVGSSQEVFYIATGQSTNNDEEWLRRIERHKIRRPNHWELIESSINLVNTISKIPRDKIILVDSLGGFVTGHLDTTEENWEKISNSLIDVIKEYSGSIVLVIEEVSWGLISNYRIGNIFRDRTSLLSQELEMISVSSWLVLQGRAIDLKQIGIRI
tara:strand:- start:132 stop:674 length:543 start_codon:yes stop_codon:yes gene_type:complete